MFAGQAGLELLILLNPGNIRKHHHTQPAVPKIHKRVQESVTSALGARDRKLAKRDFLRNCKAPVG